MKFVGVGLKILCGLIAIAIPILGAWAGSSLAAYANGPKWVALLAGLAAFPLLPLLWEGLANLRRKEGAKRILTFLDRMILRTLTLNIVFLGVLLFAFKDTLFTALAGRGDWMFDGQSGQFAESARTNVLGAADKLEFLFGLLEEDDEYDEHVDDDDDDNAPDTSSSVDDRDLGRLPAPTKRPPARPTNPTDPSNPGSPAIPDGTEPPSQPAGPDEEWPFEERPHPAAENVPQAALVSIESLAQYLVSQEDNPYQRVKLLHDWVALNIAYDGEILDRKERYGERIPAESQQAATVFRDRKGVCAGYSNLMKALGTAARIEVKVISGHTRTSMDGVGHAWNAVKIDDRWYLMDATWDAGFLHPNKEFERRYQSGYLLTPATVFGLNHFPRDERWQLRRPPLSRGEFLRQPNLRPEFYENGLRLKSPTRSQVTATAGETEVVVENTAGRFMLVSFEPKGGGERTRCEVENGPMVRAKCRFTSSGVYTLMLFVGPEQYGSYSFVGNVEVVSP